MSNVSEFVDALAGTYGVDRGGSAAAQALFDVAVCQHIPLFEADDDTNILCLWKNDTGYDLVLEEAEIMPSAAVTANDTNYTTLAMAFGTVGAYVAAVTTMTTKITGGTGDWVADTPEPFTVSATLSARTLAAGEYVKLTLDGTNGTGVDLPRCSAILRFKRA